MKNRYFQFLKGISIIAVILIHMINISESRFVNNINIVIRSIINFSVPLFIFISGYFVNTNKIQNNYKDYIFGRLKRLIIPLIIWTFLYGVLSFVSGNTLMDVLKRLITFRTAPQLYYLLVLIQLNILTPSIYKATNNKYFKIILYSITPLFLLINLLFNLNFIEIPFYSFLIFGWLIYYLIGIEKKHFNKTIIP